MALSSQFPADPYAVLDPRLRWYPGEDVISETKGREYFDDPPKWERLKQWCKDASALDPERTYRALFVREEDWIKYRAKSFSEATSVYEQG